MTEEAKKPAEGSWTRRAPMFLSAFVCPGAGQMMQQRWLAAIFFCAAFLIPFGYLFTYVLYHLFTNLKNVISWNFNADDKPIEPISFVSIIVPFLVAMVVYVAGLFDTHFAEKRLRKSR